MSASVNRGGKIRRKNKSGRVKEKRTVNIDLSEGDKFGTVEKRLGDNRIQVKSHTGQTEVVTFSGRFRNKQWISPGHIVSYNKENEITNIVRTNDNAFNTASSLINKNDSLNYYIDSSDESDGASEGEDEGKKEAPTSLQKKLAEQTARKERNKERDISRREGREFTDPNQMAQDAKQIAARKLLNDDGDTNVPIDFDKI